MVFACSNRDGTFDDKHRRVHINRARIKDKLAVEGLSRKSGGRIASQSKSLAISINQEKMKVEIFRNREEGSLRCYSPRYFSRPGGKVNH